jgi:hypothetical protein
MKSDIALHEIMRIDEYEDENVQTDLADDRIVKESENSLATQEPTESATDNSESSISVDIPTDTIINYDEPPTALIDAPADLTVMSNDITPSELANMPVAEDISNDDETSTESFAKQLESIPANTAGFFEEVISSIIKFFKKNRQLLTNLGIIFLAFIVTKLAFAGLSAIDDIPLVSPLLKLVGLFYVSRFIWTYLIRERDRQQLAEQFNSIKAQVLGDSH